VAHEFPIVANEYGRVRTSAVRSLSRSATRSQALGTLTIKQQNIIRRYYGVSTYRVRDPIMRREENNKKIDGTFPHWMRYLSMTVGNVFPNNVDFFLVSDIRIIRWWRIHRVGDYFSTPLT
jgi:hypothetical protein